MNVLVFRVALLLLLAVPGLRAETIYTYTGQPLVNLVDTGAVQQIFSQQDYFIGRLIADAPLPPNLVVPDARYAPVRVSVLIDLPGKAPGSAFSSLLGSTFGFSTDAAGNIVGWSYLADYLGNATILSWGRAGGQGADFVTTGETQMSARSATAGTWIASTDPVTAPEPSNWMLLGTGMVGLLWWDRGATGVLRKRNRFNDWVSHA